MVEQLGQDSVEATCEERSRRHCQWKWHPQERCRSSGTTSGAGAEELEGPGWWPESESESDSTVITRGSWQDAQVRVLEEEAMMMHHATTVGGSGIGMLLPLYFDWVLSNSGSGLVA